MFVVNWPTVQRTFDDLGTPLRDVTFCVLDIETTGSDRGGDGITEIGVVKVRAGECLGTMGTLVNPGRAIAPSVVVLTGITDHMVAAAPRIETVLPTLQEFVADSVIVGHNVGFDMGFINTALRRSGREPFRNTVVDTLPLARRLVRDEVPDCRLGTLASRFRLGHRPTHRALDDALATTDLLHLLLERAAGLGVMGLDDLVALPSIGHHAQAAKLRLTDALPRTPGVYRFLDARGEVLYVGKATNLRQRVRSYFGNDERRKVGGLLRETQRVAHSVTEDPLVAEVLELRYLHRLNPRYNRVGTTWQKYCYVRLTTDETWPRLVVTNEPAATGVHVGPLPSRAAAQAVIEAVQSALPIRRCTTRIGRSFRPAPGASPCRGAQLGVAMCPCTGDADEAAYWRVVAQVVAALTTSPDIVLTPLWRRVEALAIAQRYEEAAAARDRANAFAAAVHRQRLADQLRAAGELEVRLHDTVLRIHHGVLADAYVEGRLPTGLELPPPDAPAFPAPLPRDAADEVLCLARALEKASFHARLLSCTGQWAQPAAPVPEVTRLALSAA
ncbi:MAG TPA: DEDD exnuclease domain-containing protein [Acidimicrobiaceae bacterium]|nr:DEDD exnuclease domain-containing protein [Acidimicrobiaceae bacterium]